MTRAWILAAAALLTLAPAVASPQTTMDLPASVGEWTRPPKPRVIDARSIFNYMDGAGELYVAYRFDRLDVFEYTSKGRDTLLVELYWMRSSDDAFGLLSGDWGGEPVALQSAAGPPGAGGFPRALYGAGLLRLWSDTLYARVLASRETPATRQAVLDLGRAIVRGRRLASPPGLVSALPPAAGATRLQRNQITFLRSHLVLNAAYYLGTRDFLSLGPDTEAVLAAYAGEGRSTPAQVERLLIVRYPTPAAAAAALGGFLKAYLPEHHQAAPAQPAAPVTHVVAIEGGHLGYRVTGRGLVLVFDGADEGGTRALLDQAAARLEGVRHQAAVRRGGHGAA